MFRVLVGLAALLAVISYAEAGCANYVDGSLELSHPEWNFTSMGSAERPSFSTAAPMFTVRSGFQPRSCDRYQTGIASIGPQRALTTALEADQPARSGFGCNGRQSKRSKS